MYTILWSIWGVCIEGKFPAVASVSCFLVLSTTQIFLEHVLLGSFILLSFDSF